MRKFVLLIFLMLLLILFGCVGQTDDALDSGEYITPDYMEEISRDLNQSDSPAPELSDDTTTSNIVTTMGQIETTTADFEIIMPDVVTSAPDITTSAPEVTTIVTEITTTDPYENTSVYQTEAPIISDTTVMLPEVTTTEPSTDLEVVLPIVPLDGEVAASADSAVYWTPNGGVWHTKISCSTLSRSTTILSGNIDEAKTAGKDRVCKRCG